jgi:hypothetical protein
MWQNAYEAGGSAALRRAGRPTRESVLALAEERPTEGAPQITQAERQIAALERKIGQQQLDLDFFRAALRQVRERRPRSVGPGETASTK